MITRGGMSDIVYYKRIRELGMSEEYFFSLPLECQRAILMAGYSKDNIAKKDNFQKKIVLRQSSFEEIVKEKVLSLFKKRK